MRELRDKTRNRRHLPPSPFSLCTDELGVLSREAHGPSTLYTGEYTNDGGSPLRAFGSRSLGRPEEAVQRLAARDVRPRS